MNIHEDVTTMCHEITPLLNEAIYNAYMRAMSTGTLQVVQTEVGEMPRYFHLNPSLQSLVQTSIERTITDIAEPYIATGARTDGIAEIEVFYRWTTQILNVVQLRIQFIVERISCK